MNRAGTSTTHSRRSRDGCRRVLGKPLDRSLFDDRVLVQYILTCG